MNAVLRSFVRDGKQIPAPKNPALCQQVQYCAPGWLIEKLSTEYGEQVMDALLSDALGRPPVTLRRNPLAGDEAAFLHAMGQIPLERHPLLPDCYTVQSGDVTGTEAFAKGMFHVQDLASQLCCRALEPRPGDTVLDLCAAPGGKSFAAAMAMEGTGSILSCDIYPHKAQLIAKGAERLGFSNITAQCRDASERNPAWLEAFDAVIADVPCSGLGIIRKKPDIRYKDPKPLEDLPQVQRAILENAAGYVKPGGVLMYSTCTILPRENGEIVSAFLEKHPEFVWEAFELPGAAGRVEAGEITLWPQVHQTDGFFICKLRKVGEAP